MPLICERGRDQYQCCGLDNFLIERRQEISLTEQPQGSEIPDITRRAKD
jgi:hypothetical protein